MSAGTSRLIVCAAVAGAVLTVPLTGFAGQSSTATAVQRCSRDLGAELHARVAASHVQSQYQDPLQIYMSRQKLELTARDRAGHRVVARAVCTYDRSGQVTRLRLSPGPMPAH
ncbi:MAG: hypothetical protein ACREU3_15045 [Steroidobacteraceae bacterium]